MVILLSIATLITSCGSDSSPSAGGSSSSAVSMKFFDSLVSGLKYKTQAGDEGLTSSGTLSCIPNELVEFYIGDFRLGSGVSCGEKTVLPTDLFASSTITSTEVINVGVLLQSLDDDGNPNNGINIPSAVSNFEYASIDLSDATDGNADSIPDVAASFLSEVNSDSGATITSKTTTQVSAHFQISFGTNGTINKSFTNTTELGGAGTCPTAFSVEISNDTLGFSITSGTFSVDLTKFTQLSASRNLSNNNFDIVYESSDPTLDSGACAGNGGFAKSTLTIDGVAYYNAGTPNTDGNYTYVDTCVDSSTVNVCVGSWAQ